MLPNNSNEGNPQGATGGQGTPSPEPSAQGGQPLPEWLKPVMDRLDQQESRINEALKGFQKGNDTRFGKLQGDIGRVLELAGSGMNKAQIERELFLDSLMQGQPQNVNTPTQQATPGTSQQQAQGLKPDDVIARLKFQEGDVAVEALKLKFANDPGALSLALIDLRLKQTESGPTPGQGQSLTNGQINSDANADNEAKAKELNELLQNPSQNRQRIAQLRKELNW